MWFLIFLPILIGVHELAHLIAAKSCGCPVKVFSIGFGKKLLKKKIGSTEYCISAIPLGGYCKLEGENKASFIKGSFNTLPYFKKVIIALAGVTVNIIIGLICMKIAVHYDSFLLFYFGYLNFALGIFNALPLAPCLDGGYVVYMPLCIKIWGKKKGLEYFYKSVSISFKIILWLNIVCIPVLIVMGIKGLLI